jgi:steroid 5-alpha reductase family enzyme
VVAESVLVASAAAIAVAMGVLWLVSLALRDASIVDVFWGLGLAGVGWLSLWLSGPGSARASIAVALATLWGLRLSLYLLWRNAGQGEDDRYAAMRLRHGSRFAWISLATVFWLQGALMWLVSLPLQFAAAAPPSPLGGLDALGILLVLTGLGCEAVADWQLARFKADPANAGRVMDRGLWAWSRHPNYFGDFTVWWGVFALALAAGGWWTAVGPVVMSVLLLRISGVTLLERGLRARKAGYAEYAACTPAFFPRPPRRA